MLPTSTTNVEEELSKYCEKYIVLVAGIVTCEDVQAPEEMVLVPTSLVSHLNEVPVPAIRFTVFVESFTNNPSTEAPNAGLAHDA